ncbi:MAG: NAD-dependent epimerase/dehydratase family protein [Methylovulum sp.]|nr:NAD-dependent epimerase/dehydratase family protein [Methylovulum sp.]
MATILIIGCGAIGAQLAALLQKQGHAVVGLKRSPPNTTSAIRYVTADITSQAAINALDLAVDVVFFIVSADGRTPASYRDVYELGVGNALAKFARQPWFFVSSTSVYGQTLGEWVDEASPAQANAVTSQLIRQAEQRVQAANPLNVVVRFSGIYGPGRTYLLQNARQAPAIQHTPPYFTNRIHQHDCVEVLAFLLQKRLAGVALESCYLASDDDPAPLWEVVSWLAARMDCPPPTPKGPTINPDSNKRCRNLRLKALGYQFQYASYKEGYGELLP